MRNVCKHYMCRRPQDSDFSPPGRRMTGPYKRLSNADNSPVICENVLNSEVSLHNSLHQKCSRDLVDIILHWICSSSPLYFLWLAKGFHYSYTCLCAKEKYLAVCLTRSDNKSTFTFPENLLLHAWFEQWLHYFAQSNRYVFTVLFVVSCYYLRLQSCYTHARNSLLKKFLM